MRTQESSSSTLHVSGPQCSLVELLQVFIQRYMRCCRILRPSVPLLLHADVDGSLEALTSSLLALNTGRILFKVIAASVGPPSQRDIKVAADAGARIACFGVNVPVTIEREAARLGVQVVQSRCAPDCTDSSALLSM